MHACRDLIEETYGMDSFLSLLVIGCLIRIEKKIGLPNIVLCTYYHCTKLGLKVYWNSMRVPSALLELKIIKLLRIMRIVCLIYMVLCLQAYKCTEKK